MKKKKVLAEIFSLLFIAGLIFMVYVLIEYRTSLPSLVGAGAVLLITAYLMIDSLMDYLKKDNQKQDVLSSSDELISRIGELENVQKAIYTATKRNGADMQAALQAVINNLNGVAKGLDSISLAIGEGSEIDNNQQRIVQVEQSIHDLLQFIRQDQQNGVKMIIKYNKENARQIAEIINENGDKLTGILNEDSETLSRAIAENSAKSAAAPDIKLPDFPAPNDYSSQFDEILEQLKAIELKLSEGMTAPKKSSRKSKKAEVPPEPLIDLDALSAELGIVDENPDAAGTVEDVDSLLASLDETIGESLSNEPVVEAPAPEPVVEAPVPEPVVEAPAPEPEPIIDTPAPEPEPIIDTPAPEPVAEAPVADPFAGLVSNDPNKALSPDEIAALFAAAPAPAAPEPEPIIDTPAPEPEPVIDTPAPEPEPIIDTPAPEPVTEAPAADPFAGLVSNDPNKALSPDEIAALFAAAPAPAAPAAPEPEPVIDAPAPEPEQIIDTPAPEPVAEAPAADPFAGLVSNDPNKALSPDEIAALFAAAGK